MKTMYNAYAIKYYSSIKNTEVMKFADKWIEIDKIISNKLIQIQKYKHSILFLRWEYKT